jgi:hypothetical protein
MSNRIYEQVKKIIDEQTGGIHGPIAGLHSVAPGVERATTGSGGGGSKETGVLPAAQAWYRLAVPGSRLPTLQEFAREYTYSRPGYASVDGEIGETKGHGNRGEVTALWTMVQLPASRSVQVRVTASDGEVAIYLDKNRIAQGSGTVSVTRTLYRGGSALCILFTGSAVTVTLPSDILTSREDAEPDLPVWSGPGRFGYVDAKSGRTAITVEFANDPFASAWGIYRSQAEVVAVIEAATSEPSGLIRLDWLGEFVPGEVGETFRTFEFIGGTIRDSAGDDSAESRWTTIWVDPDEEAPADPSLWLGQSYVRPGAFRSLGRISDPGTDPVEFEDTTAAPGGLYIYRVTAYSMVTGQIESDYSSLEWVSATIPAELGPVTITEVVRSGDEIRVWYRAPSDLDYAGVRAYGPFVEGQSPIFSAAYRVLDRQGNPSGAAEFVLSNRGSGKYYLVSYDRLGGELREDIPTVDGLRRPQTTISAPTIPSSNVIRISSTSDEGVVEWRCWARRGNWPTVNGTSGGVLNDTYLRFVGPSWMSSLDFRAAPGTWYIVAVGYDYRLSPGPRSTRSLAVS